MFLTAESVRKDFSTETSHLSTCSLHLCNCTILPVEPCGGGSGHGGVQQVGAARVVQAKVR